MRAKEMTIKQRYNLIKKPEAAVFKLEGKYQKYPRELATKPGKIPSPSNIIKYAVKNERAARILEANNTLTLIVDVRATKPEIKEAVTKMYGAKVKKVNTLITFKHYTKKAFVRFEQDGAAIDIASKAGIL